MQLDLDRAQVALGNTTNRLMSLQNSQFVENRVYDDEETLTSSTSNVDKIQSTAEKPSLVDALQYALNSGVKMMDKYYEKVSFVLSDDSEDDEVDEAVQSSKRYIDHCNTVPWKIIFYWRVYCFQHNFPSKRSISRSTVATFNRFKGLAGKVAHRLDRFGCGRWL